MSCNWRKMTLKEAGVILIDCDHKTPKAQESGRPYIGIPQLKDCRITLNGARLISEEDFVHWRRKAKPQEHDVILSRRCNPGETGYVTGDLEIALGQNLVLLRADGVTIYPPFLRWLTRGKYWWNQVNAFINVGAVFESLKCADIPKFEILVPSIEEQKRLTDCLSSIDDKVALNSRSNQTLEQMAQVIFKSWFVDFDPVKAKMNGEQPEGMDAVTASLFPEKLVESELGLIPEGWVETPLYDIAEYINGAAYKKFEPNNEGIGLPIVKITELKAGITSKTGFSTVDMPAKYRLGDNDILFSWSGNPDTSIDTFVWALGEAWLNQHIFKVVPKSVLSRDYVLCLLKFMRPVFAEIARDKQTTGLGHVTVKDLKRLTVAVPSEELLAKFNEKVSALIAQNFSLVKQNQSLEKLRDTLLPKLLSGDIDLGDTNPESIKEDV